MYHTRWANSQKEILESNQVWVNLTSEAFMLIHCLGTVHTERKKENNFDFSSFLPFISYFFFLLSLDK